jgi:hypothetical protein
MADNGNYERGSMDISDHQATWQNFMKLATWSTLATVAVVFILIAIFG